MKSGSSKLHNSQNASHTRLIIAYQKVCAEKQCIRVHTLHDHLQMELHLHLPVRCCLLLKQVGHW